MICRGFLGQNSELAQQYHDNDFDWEEHKIQVLQNMAMNQSNVSKKKDEDMSLKLQDQNESWDQFHVMHGTAKFFKERRYLMLEFPTLQQESPPLKILELGCGCGSSVIPILLNNSTAKIVASDFSSSAISRLDVIVENLGVDSSRIQTFVFDATKFSNDNNFDSNFEIQNIQSNKNISDNDEVGAINSSCVKDDTTIDDNIYDKNCSNDVFSNNINKDFVGGSGFQNCDNFRSFNNNNFNSDFELTEYSKNIKIDISFNSNKIDTDTLKANNQSESTSNLATNGDDNFVSQQNNPNKNIFAQNQNNTNIDTNQTKFKHNNSFQQQNTQIPNINIHLTLKNSNFDVVLLIFMLSAVKPSDMHNVLRCAYHALGDNGQIFFRDYGLYDHIQLRFGKEQEICDNLFFRQDGTLSYYFTIEDLNKKMSEAGFQTICCKYACVNSVNRKRGTTMKRVFVHGVFQKATQDSQ